MLPEGKQLILKHISRRLCLQPLVRELGYVRNRSSSRCSYIHRSSGVSAVKYTVEPFLQEAVCLCGSRDFCALSYPDPFLVLPSGQSGKIQSIMIRIFLKKGIGMPFIQRSYKKKIWKRGAKLILVKVHLSENYIPGKVPKRSKILLYKIKP